MIHYLALDLRNQIFTHVDEVTGINTVIDATAVRRWCDSTRLELCMIPIIQTDAAMIYRRRGVEEERLFWAYQTESYKPLVFLDWGDGTKLLVDGTHTYVARAMKRHKWALAYLVSREEWEPYIVEGIPSVDSDTLLASHSNCHPGLKGASQ